MSLSCLHLIHILLLLTYYSFVRHVDLVPVYQDLTDYATKPLPTATKVNSFLLEKDFPIELVGPLWYFFWFGILRTFSTMFALFFSHSCPCWISWTLTCTFLFMCIFTVISCQWLLIFVCQPFLFRLSYLDHTHILYSNILILTLNTMAEPNPEKLHLTCANDHDDVRVCHWTIANHSLLLQMHWLFLYWVNEVCNELPEH